MFPDDTRFNLKVREELLWEAKRHMHESVEMQFRGFVLALDAMWGQFGKSEKSESKVEPEIKEAA